MKCELNKSGWKIYLQKKHLMLLVAFYFWNHILAANKKNHNLAGTAKLWFKSQFDIHISPFLIALWGYRQHFEKIHTKKKLAPTREANLHKIRYP
ncbi:hypothetical protein ACPCZR_26405 [Bacillus bombysepticus]